ncbi:alpha/beta fold hydrolase [Paracoccus sp. (in: a-proteobacteria)]|uniref:alpha/beta fold hydrolase n=1 Tax=Paracoccus sp. TaxID=267 RepID=UPI003A84B9BB
MPIAEYTIPGLRIRDHMIDVPLDWAQPGGPTIKLFAREVVDAARAGQDLPVLCFLQGGPGGKSPRPMRGGGAPWLREALKTHRVILPDQRGTGRSSPILPQVIAAQGEAGGDYLALFRADSIVADFDHLRQALFGGKRWQTLGQSYGGFLTLTYLSLAPQGLSACYVAGGLPGLNARADDVYRLTYPRVLAKNAAYHRRYPQDAARLARIADLLQSDDIRLPDGDRLTARRFQTIGIDLGMGDGAEVIHWLIDEAFDADDRLTDTFLARAMELTTYHGRQLFAAIHEAIYGQGEGATDWAAHRIRDEFPGFDPSARPFLLTGEMIYPWMFDDIASLRPFRESATALARRPVHTALYDPARLSANEVPVAAVIYHDDMFVDQGLSLDTAGRVGNLTHWITNSHEHDGIRQDSAVFATLLRMVGDRGGALE